MAGKSSVISVEIFGKSYLPVDGVLPITPGGIVKESAGVEANGKNIPVEKIKATELTVKIGYDSSFDYNSVFLQGTTGVISIIYRDSQIKTITGCSVSEVNDPDDGTLEIKFTCDAFIDNLTA
jgi:hypothetical protein